MTEETNIDVVAVVEGRVSAQTGGSWWGSAALAPPVPINTSSSAKLTV